MSPVETAPVIARGRTPPNRGKLKIAAALSVTALCGPVMACSAPGSTTAGPKATDSAAPASRSNATAGPAMPTNIVTAESGKTYAVGDAIRTPQNGLVIRVTRVRFDATMAGLPAGQQWALINLTFANPGTELVTVRPVGDLGVRSEGQTRFRTEPVVGASDLQDRGVTPMVNTDIPPGQTVDRLLAVIVPLDAKNLALWYAPGLIVGSTSDHPPVKIALGS